MERLSGLDATFLYVETPTMHMQVSLLALLDPREAPGGYDHTRLEALLEQLAYQTPKLRRKLVQVPLGLHHPVWVEDPHFHPVHHLKRIACPLPGGTKELADLCGRINSTPLDRSRPLWEIWVIEGLAQGQFALLAKLHHCLADGMAGAGLLASLFSMTKEPAKSAPVASTLTAHDGMPSTPKLMRDALLDRLTASRQIGRIYGRTAKALDLIRSRRSDSEYHAGATPILDVPRTPFNAPITAQRSAAFARVSLEEVREICKVYSVKVNDVVLALCAGALRRYLEPKGDLPLAPLVAACPVAVPRSDIHAHGSNHVAVMFTSLATNLEDPVERLLAIRSTASGAKEELRTFGNETMGDWAELSSPVLFTASTRVYSKYRLSSLHRPLHNVMISNVPGPPMPIYLDGSKLTAAYPMGPVIEGAGLNITVMSYVGHLDFGFLAATALVPDLWRLADAIAPSLAELLDRSRARVEVDVSV